MNNCLVIGGGNCVFKDVENALNIGEFQGIVTVNDVTSVWNGDIDAAVSLHGDQWPFWLRTRTLKELSPPKRVYGHIGLRRSPLKVVEAITHYADHMFPGQQDSGSSGLFGVKVALDELGFDRVVCCGIPMTAETRHYFDQRPWGGAANHRRGWKQAMHHLTNRVKSMSGWTAEQLGMPNAAWLA